MSMIKVLAPVLLVAAWAAPARADDALRVVVHFNAADAETQERGLKNIANMLKGADGPIEIEAVVHGPAIGLLVSEQTKYADRVAELQAQKVRFVACENTMREKAISKDQLLPNVGTVPSGALEVVRKQHAGFAYFKP